MADVTGDGNDDICFIQYNLTPASEYEVDVFEYINGNYIAMNTLDDKYESLEIVSDGSGKSVFRVDGYTLSYESGQWVSTGNE